MMNKTLQKHVFYLIGIVLFALMINLGSAFDDLISRLNKPLFQRVVLATMVLVYAYIFLVQQIYAYLFFKSCRFVKLTGFLKGIIFIILCLGIVLSIHLLLLDILLTQRDQGTFFTLDYFKNDFLLFFIPVLFYLIFLFLKPDFVLLLRFAGIGGLTIPNEEEPPSEDDLSTDAEISEIDQEDRYLALWKETRMKKFLFEYYFENFKRPLRGDIPLWTVVFFEKTATVTFGYFVNGEKWALLNFDDTILNNPWVIKINQNSYINMLYVLEKPDYRVLLKENQQIDEVPKKANRIEVVALYEQVRMGLEVVTDSQKLDLLLQISRRMKDKNYTNFWKEAYLQQLDESKLEDRIETIDD